MTNDRWSGGDIGGITGANEKCMAAAQAGNMPGTYKAFMSSTNYWILDNIEHSTVPYINIQDGQEIVIADNWDELINPATKQIKKSIHGNEFGVNSYTGYVWTGMGGPTSIDVSDCTSWSSNSAVGGSALNYDKYRYSFNYVDPMESHGWYGGSLQMCNQRDHPNPIYCFQEVVQSQPALGNQVEGSIVYVENQQDKYDAVSIGNSQWKICDTDNSLNLGDDGLKEGGKALAGQPNHDYLCYNKPLNDVNIERIGECIGDDANWYSTNYGSHVFWHVYGTNIAANNINFYCCRDEMWNIDLDADACMEGDAALPSDNACELNGFNIVQGGEPMLAGFGGYDTGTETKGCCGDDADEFYIGDTESEKCYPNPETSPKCCNNAADKIDDNGDCVADCKTPENTDQACSDDKDNDFDGLKNCADPECGGKAYLLPDGKKAYCCTLDNAATDCVDKGFTLGNCGDYGCIENNCAVVEKTSNCINPSGCGKPTGSCSYVDATGSYECNYWPDNSLCKNSAGQVDYDSLCDGITDPATDSITYSCTSINNIIDTKNDICQLKYSDCIKTIPPAECTKHGLFSKCQTNQVFSTSTNKEIKC